MGKTEKIDLKGYAYIRNRIVHSGVTPSLREIAREVGYSSPRSVQLMLARLEKRGLLERVNGVIRLKANGDTFAVSEDVVDVPLVGSVACGLPTLAEQDPEALIPISTRIARPGGTYFVLRAFGDSMNRSGIEDGNLVLVRQQSIAERGQKVVALINDEATIKHFYPEDNVVILRPNSTKKSHRPIVLSEEFSIQGVVITTLPRSLSEEF